MHKVLETATLQWRNATTPVCGHFDDVYFSADDGLAESRHNYIDNNFLPERFRSLASSHFIIAETGFGTGLNFLLAWQCWRDHAPPGKKLFYISTECQPLSSTDLQQSLACWPELAGFSEALCTSYPLPLSGPHCLELGNDVTLLLLFGDATEGLKTLVENHHPLLACATARAVDAFFLDGFAPDKNPDMWSDELFRTLARLSKHGTTLASFTAAGRVRRGLQAEGFSISKVKGFGHKREMIRGTYKGLPSLAEDLAESTRRSAYEPFWPIYRSERRIKTALVVGAGIAGCATARLLAESGIAVTVVDSHHQPLHGASGNPQAMLFPKFSHESGVFAEFNTLGYLYAQRFYRHYCPAAFQQCGMLHMLDQNTQQHAEKTLRRFQGMHTLLQQVDAQTASALANTRINQPCFWYPGSGWLRPATLRTQLLDNPHIEFSGNTMIISLEMSGGQWHSQDNNGRTLITDAVVLCNAQSATDLLPEFALPVKNIRGQISIVAAEGLPTLKTIVCHEGYIAPGDPLHTQEPFYTCGASYELHNCEKGLLHTSQQQNIHTLKRHLPDFSALQEDRLPLQGRTGFRCTSSDYLPLAGPVPKTRQFQQSYAALAKNRKAHIPVTGNYEEGLFINIAHGSRGFSTAPLTAALIRAYVAEQPWPLPFSMAVDLHPARFLIRDIMRKKTG